jgi:4'-phosphopantetheinyl transferase EntD
VSAAAAEAETAADPALARALESLAPPGVFVAHRLIAPGDARALLPEEAATIPGQRPEQRRASGAARLIARALLARLGEPPCPLPKSQTGAPLWPHGIVGSLAHDEQIAVAALAHRTDVAALGIDIEPAEPLPADMLDLVATPCERLRIADDPFAARLLFAAKEAAYKAVHPLDGLFREFHDIAVDLSGRTAAVGNGPVLDLRFCRSPRIVVLALVRA